MKKKKGYKKEEPLWYNPVNDTWNYSGYIKFDLYLKPVDVSDKKNKGILKYKVDNNIT